MSFENIIAIVIIIFTVGFWVINSITNKRHKPKIGDPRL